jgi:alanyl-tRNA synthetase
MDTMRNHTGTHVLNWALREVLGDHVSQAGSVVGPDRLRFDFSHNQAVSAEQLERVERMVNERILADEPIGERLLPLAEARKIPGVRAVFGEKYPDPVRVISIGAADPLGRPAPDQAVEFCGGTHLSRTGQAGLLKIISEESVAKGVRRITALTGRAAVAHVQEADRALREACAQLKAPPAELCQRIAAMQTELKDLRKGRAKSAPAAEAIAQLESIRTPDGVVWIGRAGQADAQALRAECDRQRQKGACAIFIGGAGDGKVLLVAMVAEELAESGRLRADEWVKAISPVVGGGGGGKSTLAQAGGKNADKLADALAQAGRWASDKLK